MGLVVTASLACAGNLPKTVVKESTKEFDIDAEVVAFYNDLVEYDEKVTLKREQLMKQLEGGPWASLRPADPIAVRWSAEESYAPPHRSLGPREGVYVYLVQQQLTSHIVRGFVHSANIFAKISAKWRLDFVKDGKEDEDRFSLKSNRLELKFEGFVDVKLEEVK